jgi:hypothetical protein
MTKNLKEERGCSGAIPPSAVRALEHEARGLVHGTVSLTLHIRDGQLARYITNRERSYMAEAACE